MGHIFLIAAMKRDVANDQMEASIEDDQIDGRRLKVLRLALRLPSGSRLVKRYWIDLERSGQIVRVETYDGGKTLGSRLDIKLAPFKVGDVQVWMPVSGISVGYGSIVDHMPVFRGEPNVVESISVLDGTMEFNKGPGPDVFSVTHDLGPPISDRLRRLNSEFAKEKTLLRPTRADPEKAPIVKLANAEKKAGSPLVAPPSQRFNWWSFAVPGAGVLVLASLITLWIQRHGR